MPLVGSDRRLVHLTGGDGRIVRLTGGDRLAPPVNNASGAGALPRLTSSGSAAALGLASGGGALARLGGSGSAMVRLTASGSAALAALAGSGIADVFSPSQIVSAWLRNNTLSGGVASEPDVLNDNPAVQPSSALQFTGEPDGAMLSDGSVSMAWALASSNDSRDRWGFARWVSFASVASVQWLYSVSTSGANANRLRFGITNTGALQAVIFIGNNLNGQQVVGPPGAVAAGVPAFLRLAYAVDGATEEDKIRLFVGEVPQELTFTPFGSGGTLGQLRDAAGSANLGAVNPSGSQCLSNGSRLGRNGFVMSDNLTTQQGIDLMNFEPLAA